VKVLIACEFSGIVRDAFTAKGHEAMSCDLLPTEIPGRHYKGDVRHVLHESWDMMIAFPPCTHLTFCGNSKWNNTPEREQAMIFFMKLFNSNIDKICIENPMGRPMQTLKNYQVINPFDFGDPERKRIYLFLKNLPPLVMGNFNPLGIKSDKYWIRKSGKKAGQKYFKYFKDKHNNGKDRSIFFSGIAKTMADQWG